MWYVEFLLLNSRHIKSTADLESDEYNDLLIVEKQLNLLREQSMLTRFEDRVLSEVLNTSSFDLAARNCGVERHKVSFTFRRICNKVALSLGSVFTDDGYLNYMEEKYHLSEEQVFKLRSYIKSNLRYKILREPYKEN